MGEASAFQRYGQACFKHRGLMLPAAMLLLLIPSPPICTNAIITCLIGIAIALVGQLIRAGTIGLEYIIRGGKDHNVFAERLVTGGLYSHVRNPMYLGNAFLLLGLAVASNSWVFLIGGLAIGVAVHIGIIGAEEHFLHTKFGAQYEEFRRTVPRLIPRLAGLGKTFRAADRFNWGQVVDKEFMKPVDWTSATALVSLVALWRADQLRDCPLLLLLIAVIVLARLVLWMVQQSRRRAAATQAG
jgi:protein-S-isoprenylcysteine O-methyltransferase Ste14